MLTVKELKERQKGLGGSDMAALLGVSPYKTPYELYIEKTIEDPLRIQKETESMQWGHLLEGVLAKRYEEETGLKTKRCGRAVHPQHSLFFASPDRLVKGLKKGLEIKNVGSPEQIRLWGAEGTHLIPEHYYPQIAQYMFVYDYEEWDVAALLGGHDFRIYTFHRDREFDAILLEEGESFWKKYIEKRQEPDPDITSARAKEFLKKLYPTVEEKSVIDLPEGLLHWAKIRQDSKAFVRQYQASADIAEAHILHHMKDHEKGIFPDGSYFIRKAVKVKEYSVPERVDIRLDYKQEKGGHHGNDHHFQR